MGDILSQSEIDELLRSLTTGELSLEEIQNQNKREISGYTILKDPASLQRPFANTSNNL